MAKGRMSSSKRSRQRQMSNVKRYRQPRTPFLRSVRVPVRISVHADSISGDSYLNYQVSVPTLVQDYVKSFSEFKFGTLRVTYYPTKRSPGTDQSSDLYAMTLLDGDSTAQTPSWTDGWFKSVANNDGSILRRDSAIGTRIWRPTEPSDREWFTSKSSHIVFNLFMIRSTFDSKQSQAYRKFNGLFVIRGFMRARITAFRTTFESILEAKRRLDEADTLAKLDEVNIPSIDSADTAEYEKF